MGKASHDKLRRLQDLLRREIPRGDAGLIFERALDLLLEKVEKGKLGVPSKAAPPKAAPSRSSVLKRIDRLLSLLGNRDIARAAWTAPPGRETRVSAASSPRMAGDAPSARSWSSTTSSPSHWAGPRPPRTSPCAAGDTTNTRQNWCSVVSWTGPLRNGRAAAATAGRDRVESAFGGPNGTRPAARSPGSRRMFDGDRAVPLTQKLTGRPGPSLYLANRACRVGGSSLPRHPIPRRPRDLRDGRVPASPRPPSSRAGTPRWRDAGRPAA